MYAVSALGADIRRVRPRLDRLAMRDCPDGCAADPRQGLQKELLDRAQRHRRKELAIGKFIEAFARAANADETLLLRVMPIEIIIADRPIDFAVAEIARPEIA